MGGGGGGPGARSDLVQHAERAAGRGGCAAGAAGGAGGTWFSTRNVRSSGAMLGAERPFMDSTCTRGGRCVSGGRRSPPACAGTEAARATRPGRAPREQRWCSGSALFEGIEDLPELLKGIE
jgi:hypothetical protein